MPRATQNLEQPRIQARLLLTRLHTLRGGSSQSPVAPEDFFPVPVRRVVTDVLGWRLEEVEAVSYSMLGHVQGRCDHATQTIEISTATAKSSEEASFSVAHEIGHAVLHQGRLDRVVAAARTAERRQVYGSFVEQEANAFAAELLMPQKAFRNRFRLLFDADSLWIQSRVVSDALRAQGKRFGKGFSIDFEKSAEALAAYKSESGQSLAEFFGVTPAAAGVRIRSLGLLIP